LVLEVVAKDHTQAVAAMKDALLHPEHGLFQDKIQVDAVGHRVVHGGEKFSASALVTPGVRAAIEECIAIAPLHNPPNLAGITACETIFPGLPQVAVFDTAFHQTMPPHVFLYGLPYEQYDKFHIRKYGFHGTSHEYVARRCADLMKKDFDKLQTFLDKDARRDLKNVSLYLWMMANDLVRAENAPREPLAAFSPVAASQPAGAAPEERYRMFPADVRTIRRTCEPRALGGGPLHTG